MEHYRRGELIACGAFSEVYSAVDRRSGVAVAVKAVHSKRPSRGADAGCLNAPRGAPR